MLIKYSCGCTSDKKTDNEKCEKHPWAEVIQIVCEEIGLFYNKTFI
jgi:hypothetical protein